MHKIILNKLPKTRITMLSFSQIRNNNHKMLNRRLIKILIERIFIQVKNCIKINLFFIKMIKSSFQINNIGIIDIRIINFNKKDKMLRKYLLQISIINL